MITTFTFYRGWIAGFLTAFLLTSVTAVGYYYRVHSKQEVQRLEASYQYEKLICPTQDGVVNIPETEGATFIQQYTDTPYAALVALQLAKQVVEQEQLKDALAWLKAAVQHSKDEAISAIARQRGARILATLGHYQEALSWLDKITLDTYAPLTEAIRGDIFLAAGEKEKALAAYRNAHDIETDIMKRQLLQLKINHLRSTPKEDTLGS